jgi:hypothetical protein
MTLSGYDAYSIMTGSAGLGRALVCVTDTSPNATQVLGGPRALCRLLSTSETTTFLITGTPIGTVIIVRIVVAIVLVIMLAVFAYLKYREVNGPGERMF